MGSLATSSGTESGSSTSTTSSPYASILANFGKGEEKMAQPLLSMLSSQMLEGLRTGGVNAFIPWIQRAVDAVRQSGSQGVQSFRSQLGMSGFGNSLAGQGAIASAEQQANEQAGSTPSNLVMQMLQGAPSFATNLAGLGSNQLANAMQGNRTTTGSFSGNTSSTPSFWDTFSQGLGIAGNIGSTFGGSPSGPSASSAVDSSSLGNTPPGMTPVSSTVMPGGGGFLSWLQNAISNMLPNQAAGAFN
jgi:hypothetical protein